MNKETYSIPQAPELEKKYRSKKAITKLARLVMGKANVAAHPIEIRDDSSVPESVEVKAYTSETETKPMELELVHELMGKVEALDTRLHKGVSLKDAWYRAEHESPESIDVNLSEKNDKTIGDKQVFGKRYRNIYGYQQSIVIRDGENLIYLAKGYEQDFHDDHFEAKLYKLPAEFEVDDRVVTDTIYSRNEELEQYKVSHIDVHDITENSARSAKEIDPLKAYEELETIQTVVRSVDI